MKKIIYYSLFLLMIYGESGYAGYLVTGPIKAEDCYTFGISICTDKTVTAIKIKDKIMPINSYFEKVSSFNKDTQTCIVNTKDDSGGLIAFATNYFTQPDLWGLDEKGNYGQIDATLIKFKCIKK